MSHGASERCEPNLIPMLDLVLQLVMFFMVVSNFVMEQVNQTIQLPQAVSAKPLDKKDDYIIFLNVNKDGHVLLSGLDAQRNDAQVGEDKDKNLTNRVQILNHMKRLYEEDIRAAGGDRSKPPRSTVILRVDKATPFGDADKGVYAVMKACRAAGYERVQIRAIIHSAAPAS